VARLRNLVCVRRLLRAVNTLLHQNVFSAQSAVQEIVIASCELQDGPPSPMCEVLS